MLDSLWGEEFSIPSEKEKTKKIIKKIKEPKEPKVQVEKKIKSSKISLKEKLALIYEEVTKILGHYKNDTLVIRDKETLHKYIDKAISNGIIAIDTETNNSLDPLTCKLMGPCIYTPTEKQAYIPLNHIDPDTRELLSNQLTEEDIKEEFLRLLEADVKVLMHNGKFDYQVINCTTGVKLKLYWDTMIAAKILDENERSAGLKEQFIDKINSDQEKYSIESLFKDIEYAVVDPDIFALYAATDSYMTYLLYLWQKEKFELKENKNLLSLFMNIEMPIVTVTAEMELTGIELDKNYAELLSKKYHNKLDIIEDKINEELLKYKDKIEEWSKTEDANYHPPKKTGVGEGKSKLEQLEDPINTASPTQLAILLYDILGVKVIDKKTPRGTGEAILEKIDLPISKLILEKRGVLKLLNAFIDSLPTRVNDIDGRVHCHFNQLGAATGRFSSSDPNLQQIPSHNKEIRMLFKAKLDEEDVLISDSNTCEIKKIAEVLTDKGWKRSKELQVGDFIDIEGDFISIKEIIECENTYILQF